MIRFSGSDNRFELRDVVLEIETELYPKLPRGYTRCLFIPGNNNVIDGLTIRNTGPNQGSNGNILSVFGNGNTLENVTLHVHGSKPYGYGDLLGKGGPNLVGLAEAERHHGRRARQHAAALQGDQPRVRALLLHPEAAKASPPTTSASRTATPRASCARRATCCARRRGRWRT